MRTFPLRSILAAGLLALPAAPAAASTPAHAGAECAAVLNHEGETGVGHSGFLSGGPMVVTVNGGPAEATVVCTIQVGTDPTYGSGTVSGEARASGFGLVIVPPTGVTFAVHPGHEVYVCTEIWVAGSPYRVDSDPTVSGDQCNETASVVLGGPMYVDTDTLWYERCVSVTVANQHKDVCVL